MLDSGATPDTCQAPGSRRVAWSSQVRGVGWRRSQRPDEVLGALAIAATVTGIAMCFFLAGLADGSVSSFNIALWMLTLLGTSA